MTTNGTHNSTLIAATLATLAVAALVGVLLQGPAQAPADPAASPVPVAPTTTSVPPAEQPGPPTVTFSESAAEHPAAGRIRALLQGYFDALNFGDYRRWTTTVVSERVKALPERAWRKRYANTTFGNIMVRRLEPRLGGGLLALVNFTSVLNPPRGPTRCLRWRVSYPVVRAEFGQLRLALDEPASNLAEPCRAQS